MSLTSQYLNPSVLYPAALADLDANDLTQRATPGVITLLQDNFGSRWFMYVKNVSGSDQTLGTVMRKIADTTIASITSATATSITKTAAGLTANAHAGKILIDETENVAGTAPEGESGVISSNTATVVSIDAALPFSAVPTVGASVRIKARRWHADVVAGVVLASDVCGVIVGTGGITAGNYGWVQFQGYCPLVKVTAAAITVDVAVASAATGKVSSTSATTSNIIGRCEATVGATNSGYAPITLQCGLLAMLG